MIFWETARPRGPENQDDCPIRLRSPRLYSSQLTQWNSVPRTHSVEGKVANWVYLNRRVFPRLGVTLSDQTINSLVRGDRNTLISFFDMLFNALEAVRAASGLQSAAQNATAAPDLVQTTDPCTKRSRLDAILAKSDLTMDPATGQLTQRAAPPQRTARGQAEYASRLASGVSGTSGPDPRSGVRYRPVECERCALLEKKVRLLEEENEFLRKKLAEK